MTFPNKIPTIMGIMLILLLVGGIAFITESIIRQPSLASRSTVPINVAITNITDTMFTVSWSTQDPATGAIILTKQNQTIGTVFDERDNTTGKLGKYTTHSVTLRGATPDTEYTITIVSDGKKLDDTTTPYRVHTPQALLTNGPGIEPAFGTVFTDTDQPAQGALVYLTLEGGQQLSTLVTASGSWIIPLNLARTADLTAYVTPQERITQTIVVRYNGQETTALSDTLNDAPIPVMYLNRTYDFRKLQANAVKPTGVSIPSTVLGAQTAAVSLIAPAKNAALTTAFPLIQGTGIPGKTVVVTLGITSPFTTTTIVGGDGLFRLSPIKPLGIGRQSVTITTTDNKGKSVAFTHMFEILKSGTQVLGDATPSATLTPSETVTLTPTPTQIATDSATPTLTPTPADLVGNPVPTSGASLPTILLLLLGISLVFGSGFAFLK